MTAIAILIAAISLSPILLISLMWLLSKVFGERERGIYEDYRNNISESIRD